MPETNPPRAVYIGIRVVGVTAILIGGFWLAAWFLGSAAEWSRTAITMKTNMALSQVLAGVSILILCCRNPGKIARLAAIIFSALVLAIGVSTSIEHLFHMDLGIDELLAKEMPGAVGVESPNRIGPPGTVSLVLLGAGLLLLASGRRRIAPYLGLSVILINLIPAVGYLYGIGQFYSKPGVSGIAWSTVVSLSSLGVGLILAYWEGGPVAQLLAEDPGGVLLRRLLPWAILVPLALGFISVQGQVHKLYGIATTTGLLVIVLILVFSILLWRSAAGLSRSAAQQVRTYEALQESEHRYRELFETMQESLFLAEIITDEQGVPVDWRYLETNPQFERYMGMTHDQLVGHTYSEAVPHPNPAWINMLGRVALTGQPTSQEIYAPTRGRWLYTNAFSPSKRKVAVFFTDVTERRIAEDALIESEERLRVAIEAADLGTWDLDLRTDTATRSLRHDQMWGYQELQPSWGLETAMRHVVPEDRQAITEAYAQAMETGRLKHESRIIWPDGSIHWIDVNGRVLYDAEHRPVRVLGVVADITERKAAEETERRREREQIEFYRRLITAATNGKLVLCDPGEIEELVGPPLDAWEVHDPNDIRIIRDKVSEIANSMGMDVYRIGKLLVSMVEAITNSIKHAGGGNASLHQADDALFFVMSDHGPGIPALALPDVALRKRFSTVGTLGMGYKIIISSVDKVYLATGPEGTTVGIRMEIHPTESIGMDSGIIS